MQKTFNFKQVSYTNKWIGKIQTFEKIKTGLRPILRTYNWLLKRAYRIDI